MVGEIVGLREVSVGVVDGSLEGGRNSLRDWVGLDVNTTDGYKVGLAVGSAVGSLDTSTDGDSDGDGVVEGLKDLTDFGGREGTNDGGDLA